MTAKLRQIRAQIKIAYLRRKYLGEGLPVLYQSLFLTLAGAAFVWAPTLRSSLAETNPGWANWAWLDILAYMAGVAVLVKAALSVMESQNSTPEDAELRKKAELEIQRLTIEAERSAIDSAAKSAKQSPRSRNRL